MKPKSAKLWTENPRRTFRERKEVQLLDECFWQLWRSEGKSRDNFLSHVFFPNSTRMTLPHLLLWFYSQSDSAKTVHLRDSQLQICRMFLAALTNRREISQQIYSHKFSFNFLYTNDIATLISLIFFYWFWFSDIAPFCFFLILLDSQSKIIKSDSAKTVHLSDSKLHVWLIFSHMCS